MTSEIRLTPVCLKEPKLAFHPDRLRTRSPSSEWAAALRALFHPAWFPIRPGRAMLLARRETGFSDS